MQSYQSFILFHFRYRGSDCESINKQFTNQGHGLSVREHDIAEQSTSPMHSAASESSEPISAGRKISLAESCSSGLSVKTNLSSDCHGKSHETLALYCVDPLLTRRKVAPKASCLIRKYSAGEISEVDTLECVEFKEIIANILGDLPPDGSYIVAVKFLVCLSPDAIFFRPLQYEAMYHEMMSDMQRSYRSSRVDPISTFDVDSHCAAFICGQWIRIIIKRFDANLHCLAIDMDNGQPHELSASKIYPLVSPFDTVPKLALKCSMLGLVNKINLAMVSDIASALLQAEEIYLSCPQRPKAIPPIFAATIHYAQSDDKGKTLINMNSQLSV